MYSNGQFGFTHHQLRKAWDVLHRAAQAGHAFTHLTEGNPRTTSQLEGLNSLIRNMLRLHRGIPIGHRKRATEWFLLLREIPIEQAHRYAHPPKPPAPKTEQNEAHGPALYDTGLTAEEGYWTRSGWAGRA